MHSPETQPALPLAPTAFARFGELRPKRVALVLVLVILAVAPGSLGALTRGLMTDAFV